MIPDLYAKLVNAPVGRMLAGRLGLPRPVRLQRHDPGQALIDGSVLLGAAGGGRLAGAAAQVLADASVSTALAPGQPVAGAAAAASLQAEIFHAESAGSKRFKALIFDASGITDSTGLADLQQFFHPTVGLLAQNGRVLVLGVSPSEASSTRAATAQRALEGFTRSLGKELGARGSTVGLVYVSPGAEEQLACTMRFLLSPRSAYVSGQTISIGAAAGPTAPADWERPLDGKVALVTGAARGIGASILATLARDGAHVIGLDVAAATAQLHDITSNAGGSAFTIDITQAEAPQLIAKHFSGGLDILIHNAGVTRDRTIAKMGAERWDELMEINLSSQERITEALLQQGLLSANGRVVCVSSLSGIAGNAGQTNYATSKAGVIGMVEALAPQLAEHQATINAVAPGFIETAMTQAMPFATREAGRRLNSLRQAGLPIDVAETVAWLANPAASGVNASIIRVCGQSLIGA